MNNCNCPNLLNGHLNECPYLNPKGNPADLNSQDSDLIPIIKKDGAYYLVEDDSEPDDFFADSLLYPENFASPLDGALARYESDTLIFPPAKNWFLDELFLDPVMVCSLFCQAHNINFTTTTANYVMTSQEGPKTFRIVSDQSTLPFTPMYLFSQNLMDWFLVQAISNGWNATFPSQYQSSLDRTGTCLYHAGAVLKKVVKMVVSDFIPGEHWSKS